MGWTRQSGRIARARRRPCLESLETRQLLSATPKPAGGGGANLNADGSTNYDEIIGASATRAAYDVDGTGQTVAVIDTGADFNNASLGGGVGSGDKIVAGVDFTGSSNGILPTWQHGTGVAGIVAGNGGGYTGVAPGADIVALRVFGDNNQGSFQEIAEALDWVIQNHAEYNITAVNLSVSDGGNYTSNLFADSGDGQTITEAVGQLSSIDIPVVIAAGNSFDGSSQGLGFPAIIPGVVSVTATDANDQLASTAQRLGSAVGGASAVTIAAPGVNITAPSGDSGTTVETGTSFATPQVTGSIILLQEMYEQAFHSLPTVAVLDQLLQEGAVPVKGSATGITVGQLDVLNSANILEQQIESQTSSGSGSISASGGAVPVSSSGSSGGISDATTTKSSNSGELTQVFVNGVSRGEYATSQLASIYPGLFSPMMGTVASIDIWAPAGSTVNLGGSPAPTSMTPSPASVSSKASAATAHYASSPVKLGAEQQKAIKAAALTLTHAATPKKSNAISSFLSALFPFKL